MPRLLASVSDKPDASKLGMGKRGPWNDRVVHLEAFHATEQSIYRRVPSLMRRNVSELIRTGHVAAGIDVGIKRLQPRIGLDMALF